MKLAKKLKKTMGLMLISTMILSAAPVMAADYDNHWAKEAITKWSEYDVVAGYGDGIFKPNAEVKRSELAAFITRVFGLESTEGATKFADVSANAWYAQDVAKVSAAGIMQGASGKFNPNGFATREEVAVTLANAFSLTGKGELNFKDQAEVAAWAKDAVVALASNGYAKGQADNKFAPKSNITRAEVVQLLDNIVKELVNKPGTYKNNVNGNVVVNTKDAVLEGVTVSGNVYLAQGIALGDATLKDTTVEGEVIVAGGGVDSLHFNKVTLNKGIKVKAAHPVRLVSEGSKVDVKAEKGQTIVLTGTFSEVVVPAGTVLDLKSATVDKIIVVANAAEAATITLSKDSVAKEVLAQAPLSIKGTGKITLLTVEANGVTSEIKPSEVVVKDGVDAPKLPSSSGGGGGGSSTGGTTIVDYITVQSIAVTDEAGDATPIPASAITINKKDITVDLSEAKDHLPATIAGATVTFGNLVAGDQISTVVNIPLLGEKELTDTVEVGGKVSYQLSHFVDQYNANKSLMIAVLKEKNYYDKIERHLNNVGLSLEGTYLSDGSIDKANAIAKTKEVLAYLEANKDNAELQRIVAKAKEILAQNGVTINKEELSLTGKVTVKAGTLGATEYTVTIKY